MIYTYVKENTSEGEDLKKKMVVLISVLIIFVLSSCSGSSDIRLPAVLSDNMVLQQNSQVCLWGWTGPGEEVLINCSWLSEEVKARAGDNGKWSVKVKTLSAGGPHSITFKGKNTIEFKNILFGEVWLCSGQSNMEWSVIKALNAEEEMKNTNFPQIRLFDVKNTISDNPEEDCVPRLEWSECRDSTVKNFSAVAYFFAKELYKKLNIPIGLIQSDWGGTPAQAWTKKEVMQNNENLKTYLERPLNKNWVPSTPAGLYNGMIHPLINYGIKGAIWYQGESNRLESELYKTLFPAMIKNWRDDWRQGDFPFYFVQIAPFKYQDPVVGALLREAQLSSMSSVPNTGMAVTMDIGNNNDIHPKNKQDVGRRLALWALAKTYELDIPVYSGPVYKSQKIERDKIKLFFDFTGGGLTAKNNILDRFTIAGNDKKFHKAIAEIVGENVVVSSKKVRKPIAVRYAFTNTSTASLFNKEGLPASSFRTDKWPIVTKRVRISSEYSDGLKKSLITLKYGIGDFVVRYTLDGSKPTLKSKKYSGPLNLDKSLSIKARAFKDGIGSLDIAGCEYVNHKAADCKISIEIPYNKRFTGTGKYNLVDGLKGTKYSRDGKWQGYEKVDMKATIDLGKLTDINSLSTGFIQTAPTWVFFPEWVEYSVSEDGNSFSRIGKVKTKLSKKESGDRIQEFELKITKKNVRYIQIHAKNTGVCPEWHKAAGGDSWIFADEVVVK